VDLGIFLSGTLDWRGHAKGTSASAFAGKSRFFSNTKGESVYWTERKK